MEEMLDILHRILAKMSENHDLLQEISGKLDNINGIYGLDDVVARIDDFMGEGGQHISDVVSKIDEVMGEAGYSLADLHSELVNVVSEVGAVGSEITGLRFDLSIKD